MKRRKQQQQQRQQQQQWRLPLDIKNLNLILFFVVVFSTNFISTGAAQGAADNNDTNVVADKLVGDGMSDEKVSLIDNPKDDDNNNEAKDIVSRSKRKSDYLTAYACEGTRLNINCTKENSYMEVIRANYGRFSIATCNDHGNTDWSVNCMSPRTLRVITSRCGNQPHCNVPVDSTIFGDPCPGTFKYVEVHYACRDEPAPLTSTLRPRPKWFHGDNVPNAWSVINNHAKNRNVANETNVSQESNNNNKEDQSGQDESDSEYTSPGEKLTPRIIEVRVPKPFDIGGISPRKPNSQLPIQIPSTTTTAKNSQFNQPTTEEPNLSLTSHSEEEKKFAKFPSKVSTTTTESVKVLVNFTQYCAPSTARGLFWNWTKLGDTAVLQCPKESIGFAKWHCGQDSNWATQAPSFAECRSMWLGDLDARLREGIPATNISNSLAYHSGREPMYGGDIIMATKMLNTMSERMHYELQNVPLESREKIVTTLLNNVVQTGSNVIDRVNHRSWNDLGREEVGRAATSMMIGLEENGFLLASSVTTEKIIVAPSTNILLSIRVMQSRSSPTQRFPSVESFESWDAHGDSIAISSKALLKNGDNGAVRLVFSTYNQLDPLLSPRNESQFVNSKIISASLGKGRHIELSEPVQIVFKHLRTLNVSNPVCTYWDYSSNSWSGSGCKMESSNKTHTFCQCNHLTNFALLMSEGEEPFTTLKSAKRVKTHISTIIAGLAALISVSVICFFMIMAWKKFKMSHQCRSALEKSGLPCFHSNKDLSDGDNCNKGNFYTVTPKLNGVANNTQSNSNEAPEVVEAQQFFEHMISLQKNQGTLVPNKRRNVQNEQHDINASDESKAQHQEYHQRMVSSEPGYPKRVNYARALSPYNHIYMEIDPLTDDNGALCEPLTHSETYMMSTVSDMSEDNNYNGNNFNLGNNNYHSDVSRQSSSRESRPLIRPGSLHERNLLQTISGVLHSQSVRIAPNNNNMPLRRSQETRTLGRLQHSSYNFRQPQQSQEQYPLQFVSGVRPQFSANTLLGRVATDQSGTPSAAVPVQVTTMNGNQFVCLNINKENGGPPESAMYMTTSMSDTYAPFSPAGSAKPGQIQAAVHSQSLVANLAGTLPRPRPQFAHPIREA